MHVGPSTAPAQPWLPSPPLRWSVALADRPTGEEQSKPRRAIHSESQRSRLVSLVFEVLAEFSQLVLQFLLGHLYSWLAGHVPKQGLVVGGRRCRRTVTEHRFLKPTDSRTVTPAHASVVLPIPSSHYLVFVNPKDRNLQRDECAPNRLHEILVARSSRHRNGRQVLSWHLGRSIEGVRDVVPHLAAVERFPVAPTSSTGAGCALRLDVQASSGRSVHSHQIGAGLHRVAALDN